MIDNKHIKKLLKPSFNAFTKEHGFVFYKPTILLRVYDSVLHIIDIEIISNRVYHNLAIQPLFVPDQNIVLSFGYRSNMFVGDSEKDYEQYYAELVRFIETAGLKWFLDYGSPEGIIRFLEESNKKTDLPVMGFAHFLRQLYLGFSYLYIGKIDLADSALEQVGEILKDDGRNWANEVKKLANEMRALAKNEPSKVKLQLDEFVILTKENLKL